MKIEDKHLYHGAAIMQIAEDTHFTAINPLKLNGFKSDSAFLINDNIAIYPKYASKPKGKLKEYQFNFSQDNFAEIEKIAGIHDRLFIPLACIHDRELCCLKFEQLQDLRERRRRDVGANEDLVTVLATLPQGKQFRVYVNASGTRGKFLGKQMLIARSSFPGILFE